MVINKIKEGNNVFKSIVPFLFFGAMPNATIKHQVLNANIYFATTRTGSLLGPKPTTFPAATL